ncbi:hypothetical protein BX616_004295 [Lobosporangium transversale]|uniref:Uncharacterized protein n=1 Tax=Lobosporangium transversale TaxID=64571 RepID=A0A1Y2GV68_9FUNG|nr:hypothetical protein BCR41DRAFT_393917 [Lobosporangium transversale]KAF9898244.1 hypothetical protein BX616_004295 [Lobosporangium transversale]ORZ24963.1 hypothetical protein BCR41DRAFT_393917 [Lobosporangium transversale]|eukprot:XP_021883944.1 hypothetical protein BCR41DRAFT_393917 [Lobosporangium transversale]
MSKTTFKEAYNSSSSSPGVIQAVHDPYSHDESNCPSMPSLPNTCSTESSTCVSNGTGIRSDPRTKDTVSAQLELDSSPPGILDYEKALQFLFSQAKQDPSAKELCQQIDLNMDPPMQAGILQYLFRLQMIGRIQEWPLLFGPDNSFILYLLKKMSNPDEALKNSINEKIIWDLRQKESETWFKNRKQSK